MEDIYAASRARDGFGEGPTAVAKAVDGERMEGPPNGSCLCLSLARAPFLGGGGAKEERDREGRGALLNINQHGRASSRARLRLYPG